MTTGHALRDQGQDAAIAADCSVTRGYAPLVAEAVEVLGYSGWTFTAEQVREWVGRYYPDAQPHHPNVLPAVLGSLASAGRITAVGHVQCKRTSRRAGWMRVWQVVPRSAGGVTPAP